MQLNNVLFMLLGGALVAVGVLASALADRIRGLRSGRETSSQRDRPSRTMSVPPRTVIPVVEPAALLRATTPLAPPAKPQRRVEPKPQISPEGGDDVIAALVASGYKRPIAIEAAWACTAAERATVEAWLAAALRRCVRGAAS